MNFSPGPLKIVSPSVGNLTVSRCLGFGVMLAIVFATFIQGLFRLFLPEIPQVRLVYPIMSIGLGLVALTYIFLNIRRIFVPKFLVLFGVLFFYSIIVLFVYVDEVEQGLFGLRRLFQGWGVMLALGFLPLGHKFFLQLKKVVCFLLVVQLPIVIYQFIILVPFREARVEYGLHMVPIDVVAGSFGALQMGGGASGTLATFLCIMLAFLVSSIGDKLIDKRCGYLLILFCILPILMGEAKIAILYLLVATVWYGVIKGREDPIVSMLIVGIVSLTCVVMTWIFLFQSEGEGIESWLSYNFGDAGHGGRVLNRTTALKFWVENNGGDSLAQMLFGFGLGAAYSPIDEGVPGVIAWIYGVSLGINITTVSTLLWEIGLVGVVIYLSIFIFAFFTAVRLKPSVGNYDSAILYALKISCLFLIVNTFYKDSLLWDQGMQCIAAICFGLIIRISNYDREFSKA